MKRVREQVLVKEIINICNNNDLDGYKKLVSEGMSVTAFNNAAIRWAATKGSLEMVKFLVRNGADMHAVNDWALRYAAMNNHYDVVNYLIASCGSGVNNK